MKKFDIIYADPPWRYGSNDRHYAPGEKRNRAIPYPTMPTNEIAALPVAEKAQPGCRLFMWGTWCWLPDALEVIRGWGFTYKTCAFVWVKTNKLAEVNQFRLLPENNFESFWGMGSWTRSNTEFCLLATMGKVASPKADRGVHQIIYAPIARHSEKPAETRDRIVRLCGDLPRLEMFARKTAPGWECWGNEVESTIDIQATVDCSEITLDQKIEVPCGE